jgi:hypothetical protein
MLDVVQHETRLGKGGMHHSTDNTDEDEQVGVGKDNNVRNFAPSDGLSAVSSPALLHNAVQRVQLCSWIGHFRAVVRQLSVIADFSWWFL